MRVARSSAPRRAQVAEGEGEGAPEERGPCGLVGADAGLVRQGVCQCVAGYKGAGCEEEPADLGPALLVFIAFSVTVCLGCSAYIYYLRRYSLAQSCRSCHAGRRCSPARRCPSPPPLCVLRGGMCAGPWAGW